MNKAEARDMGSCSQSSRLVKCVQVKKCVHLAVYQLPSLPKWMGRAFLQKCTRICIISSKSNTEQAQI